MGILYWLLFGFVIGTIARYVMPGPEPGGYLVTILLGIVGGMVGGLISTFLGMGDVNGFDFKSIIFATIGACIVIWGYKKFKLRQ